MRVLIAPQELKGTLTAVEAAEAIAMALRQAFPEWELDLLPMADGGPGTTQALLTALGGEARRSPAHDPLMRPIEAEWGVLKDGTAVIECAAASGLLRLRQDELAPRTASSYGTGELVRAALAAGCRQLIIGLGGSATNDGGAGMAQALGYRLLDERGEDLPPGGEALLRLARIDAIGADKGLSTCRVQGATDVTNPLCGPDGASAVYGPQKGASEEDIALLDAALSRLADVIRRDLGKDVAALPGAGAAGGLGAGIIAFLAAELRSGAQVVGEAAHIQERIRGAGLVITAEGRLDGQTAFGKAPQYVARLAGEASVPVVCIAGSLGAGHEAVAGLFAALQALSDGKMAKLPAKDEAAARLAAATREVVSGLVTAGRIGLA